MLRPNIVLARLPRPTNPIVHRTDERTPLSATNNPRVPSDAPRDAEQLLPLSFGQQRLWTISHSEDASTAYNCLMAFRVRGPLDRTTLSRALGAVADRQESLRTRFVRADGEARQRIDPPGAEFALTAVDLTGAADPEADLAELQLQEREIPFDLVRGPLARARLAVLGPAHHALLVTAHHTVFDGTSVEIMMRDLGACYAGLRRGVPDPLPPLTTPYAAHTRRQLRWAEGDEAETQTRYWREALEGAPPLLALPTDRPRPPEQSYAGARVAVRLDPSVTSELRALAHAEGATLFTALLTGWYTLLHRLTGEEDLVVGVPVSGRTAPDATDVIGFFVNSLPLRVDLSGGPSGTEALRRVHASLRAGLDHQRLPLERVVSAVNPPRSPAHTPLFQTMLSWGVVSFKGMLELPDAEVEPLDFPGGSAMFDLALSLAREDGGVSGYLDYPHALFDDETARAYVRYLIRLLTRIAAEPGRGIDDIELLDDEERLRLLAEGRGRITSEPAAGPLDRFREQVRVRPDAPAVVAGGTELTYAALDRRANRLAHALIARGVRPGEVVGLHCGRSAEFLVGIWGVLKAGAGYLPLDPGQPVGRLRVIVEEAAPAVILSDRAAPPGPWPSLREVEDEAVCEEPPGVTSGPSDLAYVIYTSGSTGRPKGVAVTHGNVANLIGTWLARHDAVPGEASSAWASIGFDASVHELFVPLTTGAVLHLVPEELRGDPEALMGWLREHRIVHAWLPAAYVTWIDEDPAERLAGLALRQLATGAEPLPEKALHRMREILPGLSVRYVYGPTETTVYSVTHDDPRDLETRCPIGRPVDNTRIYLLDRRGVPVPPGVAGEVFIGGAGVARGYLNRPELTEERFLPDPFHPGGRVYRTGDLARRLPDGNYAFAGRVDDQVKLRGFRIEPGEVAAALRELPGVTEAAVLADRDPAGEPRLVAGIGRTGGTPLGAHEWRVALADRLPDYMIPSLFAEFPRLPLNRSGKLDRGALLERAREAAPVQVNTQAPRDHVEMALYRIWRQVLVRPGVGVTDDFFALGGTSLAAIKVAHLVREHFGTALPIREVLQHPTIERLAARLRTKAPGGAEGDGEGETGAETDAALIEFRPSRDGRRVVCVHPAGGTAFCYLPLATALPDETGVQGVQAPGINAGELPLPSVEAMAEHYLSLVRPGPDESLVLCGLSFGGLVAHEMGRRLAEAGHRRTAVVLLDTHGADDPARRAVFEPVGAAEFREKLVRFNGMYPGIDDAQIDRYFRIYNHNRVAARDHTPPPTDAPLLLVQAEPDAPDPEEAAAADAELRGFWQRRALGGLTVERVKGGHWDVLEGESVPFIADLITGQLDRLDARAAATTAPEA
ncbi:non-ribosomal peptide synthetase [Streptomyces corynorhini]|uniref:Amino acid adenylation domain-containing protein n=1 Tax=Streptomyces corynorhini TaxID=2282652 RepID=A0A370B5T2_9ACTN|nr:non-ribosomal peptide synthetase [Streptomyces corynorhini]RDG37178.1 amino acid adenylation domain-containing protein [Streptomyces corynorhini]